MLSGRDCGSIGSSPCFTHGLHAHLKEVWFEQVHPGLVSRVESFAHPNSIRRSKHLGACWVRCSLDEIATAAWPNQAPVPRPAALVTVLLRYCSNCARAAGGAASSSALRACVAAPRAASASALRPPRGL